MSYNNRNSNRTNNSTHLLTKGIDFKLESLDEGRIGMGSRDNYLRQYHELQKEARVWYAQSQVKLAREAERRAQCLLTGNLDGYQKQVHSEHLFTPTWKFKHIIDYHNGGSN